MTADEARRFRLALVKLRPIVTASAIAKPTEKDISRMRDAFSEARSEARERMFRGR